MKIRNIREIEDLDASSLPPPEDDERTAACQVREVYISPRDDKSMVLARMSHYQKTDVGQTRYSYTPMCGCSIFD